MANTIGAGFYLSPSALPRPMLFGLLLLLLGIPVYVWQRREYLAHAPLAESTGP